MDFQFATVHDCTKLLKIYSQYIETPITFEYMLPSQEEFSKRIKNISQDYPYIICRENGVIVGYAYAHRQMEREAYQWNAELSIYIDKNFTSNGLGKKLYSVLIEILKLQQIKTVYGLVTSPNLKSENLHTSLGFKKIAIFRNTGYKCGSWHDVIWFEKNIAPYDSAPEEFISISKICPEEIQGTFEKFS